MKKIKSLRLASILLIGTLLTTCLLGGTFAKYSTSASGSSSVEVANWSFRANGKEIAVSPKATYAFRLFDTVNDADGSTEETDVTTGKIAPGTGGSFEMIVQNMSDVSTKYSIGLVETNGSKVPIQYSIDGTNWDKSLSQIAADNLTDLTADAAAEADSYTLYWRWAFDNNTTSAPAAQNDASDSQIGHAGTSPAATVMVTATITATQVD